MKKSTSLKTVDDVLAALPPEKRKAMESLRKTIRRILPKAEEGFSYGMPAFFVDGKAVAGYQAWTNFCSYYPMSGRVVSRLADELKGFETSKGGVQFTVQKPIPASLVRKLIQARIAELEKPKTPKSKAKLVFDPAATAFLKSLEHPLKAEITALRTVLLSIHPDIREGIKWNAPSYRTVDDFATVNLRSTDAVQLILHTGAKKKSTAQTGLQIDDPAKLLKWLAKDRCLCTLGAGREFRNNRKAFETVIRQWITHVPPAE